MESKHLENLNKIFIHLIRDKFQPQMFIVIVFFGHKERYMYINGENIINNYIHPGSAHVWAYGHLTEAGCFWFKFVDCFMNGYIMLANMYGSNKYLPFKIFRICVNATEDWSMFYFYMFL